MRVAAAILALVAVVLGLITGVFVLGRAPVPDSELRSLADRVVPAKREAVSCSWDRRWGAGADKTYACFWIVRGGVADVGYAVLTELGFHEFATSCKSSTKSAQFTAVKGETAIYVDVLAHGYRHRRGLSSVDADIPDRHVAVDIVATKGGELPRVGRPCAVE